MCLWWMAAASNSDPYESAGQIYCNKQHLMETEHGDQGLGLFKACYQAELVKLRTNGIVLKQLKYQNEPLAVIYYTTIHLLEIM